ncbi:MAG: ComEC/Rec2 family competence protein [Candidatus Azobacteroides sp.]|nr:ComEC/Rec2 family competence protein [Candidatus Azobacteroides sp.]
MKLLRQTPFLRPLLLFILGIVIQIYQDIPPVVLFFLLSLSILFLSASYFLKGNEQYDFRFLFGLGFSFLLFAIAIWTTKFEWEKSAWNTKPANHLYRGQVIEEPIVKPKTYLCKIQIVSADESLYKQVVDKKVIIYIPKDTLSEKIIAGDYLLFDGLLEKPPVYLRKHSFAATGFIRREAWRLEKENKHSFSLSIKSLSIRKDLLARLQKMIPDRSSYAIAAALLLGYRNEIDKDLQQSFARIGAAHILAISGTHFSILFGMLYFILSFIGNSKKGRIIKQLILFPLIWGFALLTGFSPSVVRAALMLSIWGIGNAIFYQTFTLNTVAIAAFFMLLFNPLYLFDAGFQLSFAAVLSIVLIQPYWTGLYESKNPILRYLWDLCSVSISAQLGVLPLSVYYFRQIPIIFLLTNILLIPLSALLLFLIPASLFIQFLFGTIHWLMFPLNKALDFFISIVQSLDAFSYSSISVSGMNDWEITALLLSIALLLLLLLKKRIIYLYLLLLLSLIWTIDRFQPV